MLEKWKGSVLVTVNYETYYCLDTVKGFTISYKMGR